MLDSSAGSIHRLMRSFSVQISWWIFFGWPRLRATLRWAKSPLPIASVQRTRPTLASHSAVPRGTNVKRMNANRASRIAAQRTQGLWGLISVFRGRHDRQRTLAIRIAAVTLASNSAITIARFPHQGATLPKKRNFSKWQIKFRNFYVYYKVMLLIGESCFWSERQSHFCTSVLTFRPSNLCQPEGRNDVW